MERLYLKQTELSPEIALSPDENIFKIVGRSSPEDVRNLYYPVIEWLNAFVREALEGNPFHFSIEKPFIFSFEFTYFNSSSAKFIYDIIMEIRKLNLAGIPVIIEWIYDDADTDMKEAGEDIALLSEMEFTYIGKKH
jgi:hypothetical protein